MNTMLLSQNSSRILPRRTPRSSEHHAISTERRNIPLSVMSLNFVR